MYVCIFSQKIVNICKNFLRPADIFFIASVKEESHLQQYWISRCESWILMNGLWMLWIYLTWDSGIYTDASSLSAFKCVSYIPTSTIFNVYNYSASLTHPIWTSPVRVCTPCWHILPSHLSQALMVEDSSGVVWIPAGKEAKFAVMSKRD